MAECKARKGDFVVWSDPMVVTSMGEGVKTYPRWKLGIVARATREGVAVAAMELGTRHQVKLEHKDRRISNAKTIDVDSLTDAYLDSAPPKTLDQARELVRAYLLTREEVAR